MSSFYKLIKETERKRFAVKESFDLAKRLKDEDTMTFVLTGLLVFTDKIIDDELSVQVKEWIRIRDHCQEK